MIWITAGWIVAFMANNHSVWYPSVLYGPANAIAVKYLPSDIHNPIATLGSAFLPLPALILSTLINTSPKSLNVFFV